MLVEDEDERVVQLGTRDAPGSGLSAGVWVLGPGALDTLGDVDPSGSMELDMARATERLAALGGTVSARQVGDWWRFRGRPDALLEANRFALAGLKPAPLPTGLVNTHVQGVVKIHPSARLRNAVVRGPAVIGAGACLQDAYVGPYSSIGEDVVIEGAEIEHSIILAGASIRHLGGRLEASVVGPGARVFRDFRLPRAMRLNVGEGARVSLG
jgi:glucose-1-phosphate thymidylyltransferase